MRSSPLIVFLLACVFSAVNAQVDAPLAPPDSANFTPDKSNWIELPEYRQQHRLGYRTPEGKLIFHYSAANLCYPDNGELRPVNITLKRKVYGWIADQQEFISYLHDDGSTGMSIGAKEKNEFMEFNRDCEVNGIPLHDQVMITQDNEATFMYPSLPVKKKITFRENAMKTDYTVNKLEPSWSGDMVFSEQVDIPNGFSIMYDLDRGEFSKTDWQGDVVIVDEQGNERARFRMPVYSDAAHNFCKGAYRIVDVNGKKRLNTIVPSAWVHSSQRVFPLTIDPLVTGPTATWVGGMMPSCFLPSYNADSILVTVPPQITVTALWVQSSYYADPFTNTPKSDGRMYFSTSCNSSPVLTVNGPNGQQPGTAYLQWTNYHSPLMCCWPSQCTGYNFYLRMHLARANQGVGCNTTYIYYDPATAWPFSAYIEGHTVEAFGPLWSVTPTSVCSDQCNLNMTVYVRYGVPPYTITHPWATGPVTGGIGSGCSIGTVMLNMPLTIPNCPAYCGAVTQLSVPPPVITDACGNVVTGLTPKSVTKNPTPTMIAQPPQSVCSGDPVQLSNASCVPNSTVNWTASDGSGGTGVINAAPTNATSQPDTIFYYSTPTSPQGCVGPEDTAYVIVNPYPIPNAGPDEQIETGQTVTLNGTGGTSYSWAPATWLSCTNCPSPNASPLVTTAYIVYVTENGCTSTDTVIVDVLFPPLGIFVPNGFTPDGNGVNDILQVSLLGVKDFEMHIFDRWGEEIYSWTGLNGSWDGTYKGAKVPQGVYVYSWHAVPSDLRYPPQEGTGTITVISNAKKQ